jgi:hypothetical protein
MMPRKYSFAVAVFALAACSATPKGTLVLMTGGETGIFARTPTPTKLYIDALDRDGGSSRLMTAKLPADNVDLGDQSASAVVSLHVTAVDDSEKILIEGTSVPVQLGALSDLSVPVFVQRNGEFARLPSPLSEARDAPLGAVIIGRYLLLAGGSDAAKASHSQLYDFGSLTPFESPPILPRAPRSMAALGTKVLLVDDAGATWFQLADSTFAEAIAPSGGSFAEVAGGKTIIGSDKTRWIVGGTRTKGDPSVRVLRVGADASLSFVALTAPRLGASAAWVEGRGLVVAGGSAIAAGLEILGTGASAATALPFAPDPISGQAACALDGSHLLLSGGSAPSGAAPASRVADLTCGSECVPTAWTTTLPSLFPQVELFAIDPNTALFVGDDPAGLTRAFRLSANASTEILLKVPRHGARAIATYGGSIALVGGASELEYFIP